MLLHCYCWYYKYAEYIQQIVITPQVEILLYTFSHAHTQVFKRSQYLLLQTAHPDALVRLERSPLAHQREELVRSYFQQHHSSLEDFLAHHLHSTQRESLLMHVGFYMPVVVEATISN